MPQKLEEVLQQANEHLNKYQAKEALELFRQATELAPENPQIWFELGVACCYFLSRQYEEAVQAFNNVLDLNPNHLAAVAWRGYSYFLLKQTEQSNKDFEAAIQMEPKTAEDWYGIGIALEILERSREALEACNQAIQLKCNYTPESNWWDRSLKDTKERNYFKAELAEINKELEQKPSCSDLWANRGHILANLHDGDEAIASIDKAIELQPDNYKLWVAKGDILHHLCRLEEAIPCYERATELNPKAYEIWFRQVRTLETSFSDLILLPKYQSLDLSDPLVRVFIAELRERVISSYDRVLDLNPDAWDIWIGKANFLRIRLGQYKGALMAYNKALEINPRLRKIWLTKAQLLTTLDQFEEALSCYEEALDISPEEYKTFLDQAKSFKHLENDPTSYIYHLEMNIGGESENTFPWDEQADLLSQFPQHFEDAIVSYKKAIAVKPTPRALSHCGSLLIKLKRFEEALIYFTDWVALEPSSSSAWVAQGDTLSYLRHLQEALDSYEKALEIKSDDYRTWNKRGAILELLNRKEDAQTSYRQIWEIVPISRDRWVDRADYLRSLGHLEEAVASCQNALELSPSEGDVYQEQIILYAYALALMGVRRDKEAMCQLDKVLKLKPDDVNALLLRGNLKQFSGDIEGTIIDFDTALSFNPVSPRVAYIWFERGNKLVNLKQNDYALLKSRSPLVTLESSSSGFSGNPALYEYGYEGALASYQEGLRHLNKDMHSKDWGLLHWGIGNTYLSKGNSESTQNARSSNWIHAVDHYHQALNVLTEQLFPEDRLKVLRSLSSIYQNLGWFDEAQGLRLQAIELFKSLIDDPRKSKLDKSRLEFEFVNFRQLTVDALIQKGLLTDALELAELSKAACLTWLLQTWNSENVSIHWNDIQNLLTPATAIVYWHLSPAALTTFVLRSNSAQPIPINSPAAGQGEIFDPLNRLYRFEAWMKEWDQQYRDYRSPKGMFLKESHLSHPWRTGMVRRLELLGDIINISAILNCLEGITEVILIPHRDLHRFPLHYLFQSYVCSYLPSTYLALIRRSLPSTFSTLQPLLLVENPKTAPQTIKTKLAVEQVFLTEVASAPFTEVESALIQQIVISSTPQGSEPAITLISHENATYSEVVSALKSPHQILHFTGHGSHDSQNPSQSCLFLATTEESDRLNLFDIVQVDLSSYRLACLAACETGITGSLTVTTEYVGLVSAFLKAGVANVLSTLWRVESGASTILIVQFYQELQQGQSPALALKSAQSFLCNANRDQIVAWFTDAISKLSADPANKALILLLQTRREQIQEGGGEYPFAHPYYWAAFCIAGAM